MTLDEMIHVVKSSGVVQDPSNFDVNKSFEENDLDSLDSYTILLALEEEFGVALDEIEVNKTTTFVSLFEFISRNDKLS